MDDIKYEIMKFLPDKNLFELYYANKEFQIYIKHEIRRRDLQFKYIIKGYKLIIKSFHFETPEFLENIFTLKTVIFTDNYLEKLDFNKLDEDIEYLDLNNNKISTIEVFSKNFNNLWCLNLDSNEIISIPYSFYNLTAITSLGLSNNKIEYISNDIDKFENLQRLKLSNNKLKEIPNIWTCKRLDYINLSHNFISEIPEIKKSKLKIIYFFINDNLITKLPNNLNIFNVYCETDFSNNFIKQVPKYIFKKDLLSNFDGNPISNIDKVKLKIHNATNDT